MLDYEVTSNFANWNFSAGLGPDRRTDLNVIIESKQLDGVGKFIKTWCPELLKVPAEYVHEPWRLPEDRQIILGVVIGKNYPGPIPCEKYTLNVNTCAYDPNAEKT